jgi:hypothetical protein
MSRSSGGRLKTAVGCGHHKRERQMDVPTIWIIILAREELEKKAMM